MTGHELRRIDSERLLSGEYRWRWVCSCAYSSKGQWNYQSENVARVAHQRHADRYSTKD